MSNNKTKTMAFWTIMPLICLLVFTVPSVSNFHSPIVIQDGPLTFGPIQVKSQNWAGYAAAVGTTPSPKVTAVYGSWIVQTAQPTSVATYSSEWIGIGGLFPHDATLIQTGTESDYASGVAKYNAWYELLPAAETPITTGTVSPGDKVSTSVVCVSSCTASTQSWTITVNDATKGWTFTKTVSYSSKLFSAEWIEERPSMCLFRCHLTTLASFGTANFGYDYTSVSQTNYATIAGVTAPISGFPNALITMVDSSGKVLAQPSVLSPDGTSFTVTRNA